MNDTVKAVGAWTFVLIFAYLVLSKSGDTDTVVKSVGGQYTNAIRALQGQSTFGG